jgi:hypothetical protein
MNSVHATIGNSCKPAASEIDPQEDEHLNWTKEQMSLLEFEMSSE